jgi:DNA topoisomerase-1
LSIGRVQGPTLAFVVDRDMEIKNHVYEPYWTVSADFEKDGSTISTHYYKPRISTLSEATSIVSACKNQDGRIDRIESQKLNLKAGPAFNLGDLQKEAYRVFRFSPSYTLSIAEKLYISALISYPRTSSQKLPASINYKLIISDISKIGFAYTQLTNILLARGQLSPIEGNKTDPAHPAIYPTGKKPKSKLSGAEFKLLDLIIRRFLASFGDPARTENKTVAIHIKDEHIFIADGKKMLYDGWTQFYKPYLNFTETILPELHEGEILRNAIVSMSKKYTQPPPRFNQSTLLELMEKENIGTKATRSEIISTLFKRNYISNVTSYGNDRGIERGRQRVRGGIEATEIGLQIIQSMRKYVPILVSANLSRSMEEQLEGIETGRIMSSKVISQAAGSLNQIIAIFKQNENQIGKLLTDSVIRYRNKLQQQHLEDAQKSVLGSCPLCSSGYLKIIRSRATKKRFVGCSNYSTGKCNASAPLPQAGLILIDGRKCSHCKWPLLKVVYKIKRKWEFCINSQCRSKKVKA